MATRSDDRPLTDEELGLPGVHLLTPEEGWAILDRQARRWLGISAQEFVDGWNRGDFIEREEDPDVYNVSMLLPLAP